MMNLARLIFTAALAAFCIVFSPAASADSHYPLFDGESLKGWSGNPEFWRVEDGAIVGQTTKEKPTKGNTFLIWEDGEVDDFELLVEQARQEAARSRIFERARSSARSRISAGPTSGASGLVSGTPVGMRSDTWARLLSGASTIRRVRVEA